jgi:hypothetical protein
LPLPPCPPIQLAVPVLTSCFPLCGTCRFHINALNLPIVNGPNEGVMLMVLMYLFNGYYGMHRGRASMPVSCDHTKGVVKALSGGGVACCWTGNQGWHGESFIPGVQYSRITLLFLALSAVLTVSVQVPRAGGTMLAVHRTLLQLTPCVAAAVVLARS